MPKAEYEEKFIVINMNHLKKLDSIDTGIATQEHPASRQLRQAIFEFQLMYDRQYETRICNNSYYVCNQDEPYAQKVIDTILEGESEKT